jgi:hypothetical protein
VQYLSPLPGDLFSAYYKKNNNGCLELKDTEPHRVRIEVKDANGNSSILFFNIKWNGKISKNIFSVNDSRYMFPDQINIFETPEVQMVSSDKSFYDAFRIHYSMKRGTTGMISNIHTIHTSLIPAHDSLKFHIKSTVVLSPKQRERVIMIKSAVGKIEVEKALHSRGWYEARFREFGIFWLEVDEVPPVLNITGVNNGSVLSAGATIVCNVQDNNKEIRSFRAELDGKWLMFEGSGPEFRYRVDEYCPPGEHELVIKVEDEAGNKTEKIIVFRRE